MSVRGWRAYYPTGVIYDSASTSWDALPSSGLQMVILFFDSDVEPGVPYRRILMGNNYYYETASLDIARDGSGFEQRDSPVSLRDRKSATSVKTGTLIGDSEYNAILKRAVDEVRLPGAITPAPSTTDAAPTRGLFGSVIDSITQWWNA